MSMRRKPTSGRRRASTTAPSEKADRAQKNGERGEAGGDEGGDVKILAAHEQRGEGDHRADDEPHTEGSTDQAHSACSRRGGGEIADHRLRRRDIPPRKAVDDPREEEEGKRMRDAEEEEPEERPDLAGDEDRPPPDAVRESSEDRRADELQGGIRCAEHAHGERIGAERRRIEGKEGNDDRHAQHVDQDHGDDGQEAAKVE
jgi:hypothetical protein